MSWRYEPYFKVSELACKCGCGFLPNEETLDWLLMLRIKYGRPMIITSGGRCPEHNRKVSKSGGNGPHTIGAIDTKIYGERASELLYLAYELGVTGVGVGQNLSWALDKRYLHFDVIRKGEYAHIPRNNLWSY